MQVKDLMEGNIVSVAPDETAAEAARLLAQHNVGSLPVCGADGGLRGVITDRDIVLRCVAIEEDPAKTEVQKIMTRNCAVISPKADAREAAQLMASKQVRRLPVVENDKVVGMVSLGDLSVSHGCDMEAAAALCEISEASHETE